MSTVLLVLFAPTSGEDAQRTGYLAIVLPMPPDFNLWMTFSVLQGTQVAGGA